MSYKVAPEIIDFMQENDFGMMDTGGGCTAWYYLIKNSNYLLITETNGCQLSKQLTDNIYFGIYTTNGEFVEACEITMAEFMKLW